jgi:Flp pilus assembly protein TadB
MFSFLTKIWLFLLVAAVLAISLLFSVFLFAAVLVIAVITIPYVYYVKWKAKKEVEKIEKDWIEAEYTCEPEKKLKDRF